MHTHTHTHTHTNAETQISSLALRVWHLVGPLYSLQKPCKRAFEHTQTSSLTLSGTTSSSTKSVQTHTCTQMHVHTHTHKPPVWHWAGPLHPLQQPCVFSPVTSANSHKCSSWKKNWFLHCKRTYFPGKDQIMMTVMFSSCLQKLVITMTTTNS